MPTAHLSRETARARRSFRAAAIVAIATIGLGGCSSSWDPFGWNSSPYASGQYSTASVGQPPAPSYGQPIETGVARWDTDISSPGMTAAHPTLPLGSWARVTNTSTAASVTVRITRRLISSPGRQIELSRDAAATVGAMHGGGAPVMIEPLDPRQTTPRDRIAIPAPAAPAPTVPAPAGRSGIAYDPSAGTASIPTAVAAPAARGAYAKPLYLQFGSFRAPGNAYRMKERLEREGLSGGVYGDATVETTVVKGAAYHRVRLGPLESPADAQRALRQAEALGHKGARLLRP